jgi:PAS domain S-box-containing protein
MRRVFTLAAAGIGEWDLELETGRVRRSVIHDRIFGYDSPARDWNFDVFLDRHVHHGDREFVAQQLEQAVSSRSDLDFECRIIRNDGQVRWIWERGSVFYDAEGNPTRILGVVQDITGRKEIEEEREKLLHALNFERSRLTAVFEKAPALIAITRGPEHVFEMANPRYRRLVGNRELIGKTVRAALPDLAEQGMDEQLDSVYRSGEPYFERDRKFILQHEPGGETFEHYLDFTLQPLLEPTGAVRGLLLHAVDVTDHREAVSELTRAREELEQRVEERTADLQTLNAELESFNYSVSHDLRAPLRGIDGFSQLLLEEYGDKLDETARHYLQRIHASAARMDYLINDLLNLSQLAHAPRRRQVVDLSALARAMIEELSVASPERKVTVSIQEQLETIGDKNLLGLGLENLLGNAWKFTRQAEDAHIEFGAIREGQETVYFVRDNGAGFDMRYAARLFEAFQRVHSPEEFDGSGIGLAIVQRVITELGGRVWAEGEPGRGATFYFTLPREERE